MDIFKEKNLEWELCIEKILGESHCNWFQSNMVKNNLQKVLTGLQQTFFKIFSSSAGLEWNFQMKSFA